MMIIKYRSSDDRWNWFSDVEELKVLGRTPITEVAPGYDALGIEDQGMEPFVMNVSQRGQKRTIAMWAVEAYLTEQHTGNTIEVLIRNGQTKSTGQAAKASRRKG